MAFTELRARDPRMLIWVEVMAFLGNGGSKFKYGVAFFRCLDEQLLMIEEYAYTGTDLRGDPDLALVVYDQWGDISE